MSASRTSMRSGFSSRSFSSKSKSSRSVSSASRSGAMDLMGLGSRISQATFQTRAPSVYGGAGGFGTRISTSTLASDSLMGFGDNGVVGNEKGTMQDLNYRLASYLEKVRSLESANLTLELQIREFYEKKIPASRDFTSYFATISELRAQIAKRQSGNQRILLQIDNTQLAAEDFRVKWEMDLQVRRTAEADLAGLQGLRDRLTLEISDVEMQIEGLKEELLFMNKNHQEDLLVYRAQQSGAVNVEVDSSPSVDLAQVLEDMREQYEALVIKRKLEVERWFESQVENLRTEISVSTTDMQSFSSELTEVKRSYQSFEIRRQGAQKELECLQLNLEEVKNRHIINLHQLQQTINVLETELQNLKVSRESQQADFLLLLDIKMRLELEIAEYRRLLDGDRYEMKTEKAVLITKVVVEEVEEHKPHIERRVRTIVEELVDGQVVSKSVDTQVENIQ